MNAINNNLESIDFAELVRLCAVDDEFYARRFFPRTVRQASPRFHREIDAALSVHANRFVAAKIFRGGAKTSKLRLFTSKRIALGISHTILYVSKSQGHSMKSVEWIKKAVEFNKPWADTFKLRKGARWTGEDIEIIHGIEEYPIRIIALGITGQIRGINIEDFRPDLIICDDPDDEESTATPEQREKTSNLFFGALAKSLAPESEAPDAKMVLAQTPLNRFDLVNTCSTDPQWLTLEYGCFDEAGESRWPSRWTTQVLLKDKEAHIQRRQLPLWLREMECKIVSSESASFDVGWLKFWDVLPDRLYTIIAIDPASSDSPTADDLAIVVLGFRGPDVYIIDSFAKQGVMPDAVVNVLFEFILKYRPMKIVSESVSYQRILAWYVRKEMEKRRVYVMVQNYDDKRRKSDRIIQAHLGIASTGHLYVHHTQTKYIEQFTEYSPLFRGHDDVIDAAAIGISAHQGGDTFEGDYESLDDESDVPKLENWRAAP